MAASVFLVCALLFLRGVQSDDKHSVWNDYKRAIELLKTKDLPKEVIVHKPMTYYDIPTSFPCNISIPQNRTDINVHSLHPTDIKVIGAMGDSLTAAYGALAENVVDLILPFWESEEARGVSFSVGGDPNPVNGTTVTLPTILMQYESENELVGYSLGRGSENDEGSNLNVAVGGATSDDMPEQALILIERMKSRPEINYYHDWKVVTLFIGGNDLCGSCRNPERFTAQNYINNVRKALDIMYAELPKTFVNLVSVLQVTEINKLDSLVCNVIHRFVCSCAKASQSGNESVAEMTKLTNEYHKLTRELVNYGRYDTRDDFTVVVQPFLEDTGLPWNEETGEWDDSIMAPDCFHFSELGHQLSAGGLWNNMFEDMGNKTNNWDFYDLYAYCPVETDVFKTRLNSDPSFYVPPTGDPPITKPPPPTTTPEPTCEVPETSQAARLNVFTSYMVTVFCLISAIFM